MNDLAICKRIAEIEGLKIDSENASSVSVVMHWEALDIPVIGMYNPLTDDALLMGLIRKHIQSYRYDTHITPEYDVNLHCFTTFHGSEVCGEDYARTALESIIESRS